MKRIAFGLCLLVCLLFIPLRASGQALAPLDSGTGVIMVLVTLQ